MRKIFSNPVIRYFICMTLSLLIGVILNMSVKIYYNTLYDLHDILPLIIIYFSASAILGIILLVIDFILYAYERKKILYIVASGVVFLSSMFLFPPVIYDGLHIFVVMLLGVFIFSVDRYASSRPFGNSGNNILN